ncbi:ATP-binding protein [Acidiferrimicrobium sp. IK]|uniref:ATP-binding protein n=1 Tax=Acidiferrimicrobium sp. IK TaxID=2871700 RepID=UPI0021CB7A68|nr:ATP-binding protein [Acidiferrimicrobium sp. IK]MCU4183361.1 ATP-binding protein [Acidiferrimicrobium sp. IK]
MSDDDRLSLEPMLSSVARARVMVGEVAARHGFDPVVAGDAALVVSELVTNAVLHARTAVDLAVGVTDATVRIEVTDASDMPVFIPPPLPILVPEDEIFDEPVVPDLDDLIDALATTGRGMELVASISTRWGVTAHAEGGKTVWAEVGIDPAGGPAAPARAAGASGAAPGLDAAGLHPAVAEDGAGRSVRLVAVPLRLIADSDRNFDDTIRELQVIALSDGVDPEVGELARSATQLLSELGPLRYGGQEALHAARDRGDRLADLHLAVGPDTRRHLRALDALLGAIAAARSTGKLLVMAPMPEVVAFRLWYHDEVLRQLGGQPAQPCPFPVVRPDSSTRPADTLSDRRLQLLSALEERLAGAGDRRSVAEVALERVRADTGASFANLLLVEPDGAHVSGIHRVGYEPDEPQGLRYAVSHDNPISESVRTAEPVVLRTRDERLTRYPRLIPSKPVADNPTAVWVPLGATAPASGVLVVGFGRARDFTDKDLRYLLEVARVIHQRLAEVGPA